jgi:ribose 5-phosphate isomerase B
MEILMGSDHIGFSLKEDLKSYLKELGHNPIDLGCFDSTQPIDYPDVALELAEKIAACASDRGILICGTGIGMAIVANKIPGVRAACCHDPFSAERARKSNNAQILTMGAQIVAPTLARLILDHWLASEFSGGRSLPKVVKIDAIDLKFRRTT